MKQILCEIKNWFDQKNAYFLMFSAVDTRAEGWFKGEMLLLCVMLQYKGLILEYEVEYPIMTGERIDFKLRLPSGEIVLLEFKALCISKAKSTRGLSFYISDSHLFNDLKKLQTFNNPEVTNRYSICFIYPKPKEMSWRKAISKVAVCYPDWQCETSVPSDELSYYMSVWKWKTPIQRKAA